MRIGQNFDYSTLKWVKGEIDESLKQARLALETYVENQDDEVQMRFCITHLHQVYGTLQMVELYGASMVAEEMEQVAYSLLKGEIKQRDDAFEVLMRAIVQLPDYLDRLQAGHRDVPIVLLPLLNDLRAARQLNLLSESVLFVPDLNVEAPLDGGHPADNYSELVRRHRHPYQLGLLGWFRNNKVEQSLQRITDVLDELRKAASTQAVRQLFWIAGGLVCALKEGSLESSVSVKLLLGHVDRMLKKLIDDGELAFTNTSPQELIRNLLFYVASAESETALIVELKDAFKLHDLVPREEEIDHAQRSLGGRNTELMETVSNVMREDIANIKDTVDVIVHSDNRAPSAFEPMVVTLRQIGDTLGMIGLGMARNVVVEQTKVVQDIIDEKLTPDDETLMEFARALLYVETALDSVIAQQELSDDEGDAVLKSLKRIQGEEVEQEDEDGGSQLPESEYRDLVTTVVREAKTDLSRIKDAVVGFIDAPMDHDLLESIPSLIAGINGSLLMLSLPRAAEILDACSLYINEQLLSEKLTPSEPDLENLAEAIASVEYYMEAFEEGRAGRETILHAAELSVATIGYPVSASSELPESLEQAVTMLGNVLDQWLTVPSNHGLVRGMQNRLSQLRVLYENTRPEANVSISNVFTEMETMLHRLAEGEVEFSDEIVSTFRMGYDTLSGLIHQAPEQPPLKNLAENNRSTIQDAMRLDEDAPATADEQHEKRDVDDNIVMQSTAEAEQEEEDEIDDEIIEIFIEEAEEQISLISDMLDRWRENQEDRNSLTDLRRAFHTLKGSGRLVGAKELGEFAWAFENMLNCVIDGTVEVRGDLLDALARTLDVLPQLVAQFKDGTVPSLDIEGLIATAWELSGTQRTAPRSSKDPKPQPAVETKPEELLPDVPLTQPEAAIIPESPAQEETTSQMDPVLCDIFVKEANSHLDALAEFIKQARQLETDAAVNDSLMRALHTLHGSARMADVTDIAELGNELEKYVKAASATASRLSPDYIDLLEHSIAVIREMVGKLPQEVNLTDKSSLIQRALEIVENQFGDEVPEVPPEPVVEIPEEVPADLMTEITVDDQGEDSDADQDEELIEIFLEEGADILDACEIGLQSWLQAPDDAEVTEELQRQLHTLKGGARMAGITPIGDLGHSMESMLLAVIEGQVPATTSMVHLVQDAHDTLLSMLEQVRSHQTVTPAEGLISKAIQVVETGSTDVLDEAAEEAPAKTTDDVIASGESQGDAEPRGSDDGKGDDKGGPVVELVTSKPAEEAAPKVVPLRPEPEPKVAKRGGQEQVRVNAELIDNLVNFGGEVSIYRARLEQQINSFKFNLAEMDQTVTRLRDQLRNLEIETEAQMVYRMEEASESAEEFDPLEFDRFTQMQQLSRSLMESVTDLVSLQRLLENQTRESETLLVQQSRINTELQEGLMRTRMVPFAGQLPRLQRIVRQTCNELKKKAELNVTGAEGEMDRTMLERIMPAIEHMLRNAIDHGLETPAQRKKAKKDEAGTISISFSREGSEVVLCMTDDGSGIDLDAIRKKATEKGFIDKGADLSENELLQFILESGFSTAGEVTQISGRGVGMDVVNSEIKQLGGTINIASTKGAGTTFTIHLPFTMSVNRALMAYVGEDLFAVPLLSVEGIARASGDELQRYYTEDAPDYEFAGNSYRFMHLGTLLGLNKPVVPEKGKKVPVLLARVGDHRVALQVENLMGSREIVVKPVGPQVSTVPGVSGATILGDGSVVLILDLNALIRTDIAHHVVPQMVSGDEAKNAVMHEESLVMIVDDSITVRKVTERFLKRHNLRTITAKDGVDALTVLQEHIPDVMLLDIEMPRMDGYELATHMRNDDRFRDIPIIMITSRTGEKHRQRAMQIGVNEYLGKPYQETELLEHIQVFLEDK